MYAAALHRNGIQDKNISRHLAAIRSWFNYLIREKRLKANPTADVRVPAPGNVRCGHRRPFDDATA